MDYRNYAFRRPKFFVDEQRIWTICNVASRTPFRSYRRWKSENDGYCQFQTSSWSFGDLLAGFYVKNKVKFIFESRFKILEEIFKIMKIFLTELQGYLGEKTSHSVVRRDIMWCFCKRPKKIKYKLYQKIILKNSNYENDFLDENSLQNIPHDIDFCLLSGTFYVFW